MLSGPAQDRTAPHGPVGPGHGHLWLVKSQEDDPQSDFTLRRVEHLRRTVVSTLEKLLDGA